MVTTSKDWPALESEGLRNLVPYPTDVNYNPLKNIFELDLPPDVQSQPIWLMVEQFQMGRMDAELFDMFKDRVPIIDEHGVNAWPRKVKINSP